MGFKITELYAEMGVPGYSEFAASITSAQHLMATAGVEADHLEERVGRIFAAPRGGVASLVAAAKMGEIWREQQETVDRTSGMTWKIDRDMAGLAAAFQRPLPAIDALGAKVEQAAQEAERGDIAWRDYGMTISGLSLLASGADMSLLRVVMTVRGLTGVAKDLSTRGFGPLVASLKDLLSSFSIITLAGAGVAAGLVIASQAVDRYADKLAKAREASTALGERTRDLWKLVFQGPEESPEVARLTKGIEEGMRLKTAAPVAERGGIEEAVARLRLERELALAREQAYREAMEIQEDVDSAARDAAANDAETAAAVQGYADQFEAYMRIANERETFDREEREKREDEEARSQEAITDFLDAEYQRRQAATERDIEEGARAIDRTGKGKGEMKVRATFVGFDQYIRSIQEAAGGKRDVGERQLTEQQKATKVLNDIYTRLGEGTAVTS